MMTAAIVRTSMVKVLFVASMVGICPRIMMAATPQELLSQCETKIKGAPFADLTVEVCLNAERAIRSVSANSREHVKILEQLALVVGYHSDLKPQEKNYYMQALEAARQGFGDLSPETFEARTNLGAIALVAHDWQGARKMYQELISGIKKQNADIISNQEINAFSSIAKTYRIEETLSPQTYKIADHLRAEKNYLDMLQGPNLETDFGKSFIGDALLEVAYLEMKQGALDRAEKDTQEAIAAFEAAGSRTNMADKLLQKIRSMK